MPDELKACPGCGASLPASPPGGGALPGASVACSLGCAELATATLALGDAEFLHQLAVDAYGAQHGPIGEPSIRTAFSLAGLYLAIERGFDGRQVQRAHMLMARRRRAWPIFVPPRDPEWLTVHDVLARAEATTLREALKAWGESVWAAWGAQHVQVEALVRELLDDH